MESDSAAVTREAPVQAKKKPPVGILLLALFLVYSIYTEVMSLDAHYFLIGPFIIQGTWTTAYRFFSVLVLALILFAILKRKRWALPIALSWYGLLILQAIAHLALSYF